MRTRTARRSSWCTAWDLPDVGGEASAVLLMGTGSPSQVFFGGLTGDAPTIPLAITAESTANQGGGDHAGVVRLLGEPTEEELDRAAREARSGRVRKIWILTISVLVTVMGIANAMLMSVTERFREIGTMKCLRGEVLVHPPPVSDRVVVGRSSRRHGRGIGRRGVLVANQLFRIRTDGVCRSGCAGAAVGGAGVHRGRCGTGDGGRHQPGECRGLDDAVPRVESERLMKKIGTRSS